MTSALRRLLVGAIVATLALATLATPSAFAQAQDDYEVLVVGKTLGFRHSHIDDTTHAIIDLGEEHGFTVDVWDPPNDSGGWWGPGSPGQPDLTMDSTPFTSAANLAQYATIIFVSPVDNTNSLNPDQPRLLNDAELAALQGYVRNGGGVVGIHAATDTMHTSPWFTQLIGGGARFRNHPAQQTATMVVEDPNHPTTEMLPTEWVRFDEWYNYTTNPRENVHVLMTLDESTYNPGGGAMGEDHPIAWCQNFDGGRSFYQGAGHTDASWQDPLFLEHILRGIQWTAGVLDGGGNCVTFNEVWDLVDAVGDDSARSAAATRNLERFLGQAEDAADEGDRATALRNLRTASTVARAMLRDDVLVEKLGDLMDWQRGLPDADQ